MAYTAKHTWNVGEVITKAKMDAIEDNVQELINEVTGARTYSGQSSNTLGARIDDLVIVSDTTPTEPNNEIWLNTSNGATISVEVPDMEDFENLRDSIAEEYSTNSTYAVGDYVYNEGVLYRCTTAITTGEAWTIGHWEEVKVGSEISELNENLNTLAAENTAAVGELKSAIDASTGNVTYTFTRGGYYQTANDPTLNGVFKAETAGNPYVCVKIPCQKGDVFTARLSAAGGSSRVYGIYGSENQLLDRAVASDNVSEANGTIPVDKDDASYIVFNNKLNALPDGYYVIKNAPIKEQVDTLETDVAALNESMEGLENTVNGGFTELKNAFVQDTEWITGTVPLVFEQGYYRVYNDNTVVDISAPERTNSTSKHMVTALVACQPGDKFTIKAYGGSTAAAAWGFLNADKKGIQRATANKLVNETIEAPSDAAYFIVNNDTDNLASGYWAYKGDTLLSKSYVHHGSLTDTDDLNNLSTKGWYMWTNAHIPLNAPKADVGGKLLVFGNGTTSTAQLFLPIKTGEKIWYRTSVTGTWTEVANTADVEILQKYIENGIYMYPLSGLPAAIQEGGSTTNNGITFTYVGGDERKITLSLSGTATSAASINLVQGKDIGTEKVWLRIDKVAENPNVYIRYTATSANYPESAYETSTGAYVFRLGVAKDTVLDNYIVTCAVQSAPSNEELRNEISSIGADDIPAYYYAEDYLANKIADVQEHSLDTTDSFVFVTDYHAHKNTGYSPSLINKIYSETGISKLYSGGDIGTSTGLGGSMETNAGALKTLRNCVPTFLTVMGNHEWMVPNTSYPSGGTFKQVYSSYMNQMEPHASEMSDFGDYWIDSKVAKIRYFFLNQNFYATLTDISLKWFMQELPKVPTGYGIVVSMHHAYHFKVLASNNFAASEITKFGDLRWDSSNSDTAELAIRNLTARRISQLMEAVRTRTTVKYALRPHTNSNLDRSKFYTPYIGDTQSTCGTYNPILSTFDESTTTVGEYTDIVTFDGASMNTGVYPIAIFCGHKHEDSAYDPASASSTADMNDTNTVYLLNDTWYRYDSKTTSEHYGEWVPVVQANGVPDNYAQTDTVPPILVILTTTDCCALKHSTDPTVRTAGTITEQAFDVVQIDADARKIYCTRIGGGVNRVFSF